MEPCASQPWYYEVNLLDQGLEFAWLQSVSVAFSDVFPAQNSLTGDFNLPINYSPWQLAFLCLNNAGNYHSFKLWRLPFCYYDDDKGKDVLYEQNLQLTKQDLLMPAAALKMPTQECCVIHLNQLFQVFQPEIEKKKEHITRKLA